jgi:hypothetical protein
MSTFLKEWRNREDIPNTEGFKLTLRIEGISMKPNPRYFYQVRATALRNSVTGCHYLHNNETNKPLECVSTVRGWKPRT